MVIVHFSLKIRVKWVVSDIVQKNSILQVIGTAPTYLQTLVRPHAPVRALRSTTSAGTAITESKLRLLSKVATQNQCQDSSITVLQKTQDSFVQTSP